MNLSVKKVEANRNFANKLWNSGRFVISAVEKAPKNPEKDPVWTPADEYIHARMRQTVRDVNRLFESYQFGEAGRQIYEFFWNEFADWYIESAKSQLKAGGDRAFYTTWTLVRVLDKCLRMLHPFTPYVTEELWGHIKNACQDKSNAFIPEEGWKEALIIADWPNSKPIEIWENDSVRKFISITIDHTKAFRALKTQIGMPIRQKANGTIIINRSNRQLVLDQEEYLTTLGALQQLEILEEIPDVEEYKKYLSASVPSTGSMVFLRTEVNAKTTESAEKLQAELGETEKQIERLEMLLASDFASKAPPQVVQKEREKLESYKQAVIRLKKQL
jgi:valyl-tRNA synthetase